MLSKHIPLYLLSLISIKHTAKYDMRILSLSTQWYWDPKCHGDHMERMFCFRVNFTFKPEEYKLLVMENKSPLVVCKVRPLANLQHRNSRLYPGRNATAFCRAIYLPLVEMPLLNLQKVTSNLSENSVSEKTMLRPTNSQTSATLSSIVSALLMLLKWNGLSKKNQFVHTTS